MVRQRVGIFEQDGGFGDKGAVTSRIREFIKRLQKFDWKGAAYALSHYMTLPLIAIAIVIVLVSEDMTLRLAGIIALIFLEQIRDAWVVREISDAGAKKKN